MSGNEGPRLSVLALNILPLCCWLKRGASEALKQGGGIGQNHRPCWCGGLPIPNAYWTIQRWKISLSSSAFSIAILLLQPGSSIATIGQRWRCRWKIVLQNSIGSWGYSSSKENYVNETEEININIASISKINRIEKNNETQWNYLIKWIILMKHQYNWLEKKEEPATTVGQGPGQGALRDRPKPLTSAWAGPR